MIIQKRRIEGTVFCIHSGLSDSLFGFWLQFSKLDNTVATASKLVVGQGQDFGLLLVDVIDCFVAGADAPDNGRWLGRSCFRF